MTLLLELNEHTDKMQNASMSLMCSPDNLMLYPMLCEKFLEPFTLGNSNGPLNSKALEKEFNSLL